jgi:hypothetical protein
MPPEAIVIEKWEWWRSHFVIPSSYSSSGSQVTGDLNYNKTQKLNHHFDFLHFLHFLHFISLAEAATPPNEGPYLLCFSTVDPLLGTTLESVLSPCGRQGVLFPLWLGSRIRRDQSARGPPHEPYPPKAVGPFSA